MTDQQHLITPPPELMRQWREQAPRYRDGGVGREEWLMERSAQWGYEQRGEVNEAELQKARDQELEAVKHWLIAGPYGASIAASAPSLVADLRAALRPKPPSLKEQALMALEDGDTGPGASLTSAEVSIIRRALEALPND